MLLIVGLGNPGNRYTNTRHNIGERAVSLLHTRHIMAFEGWRNDFNALVAEGRIADTKVVLMLPQTYMNDSGHAVIQAVNFWKLAPSDVLVVSDDLALPLGKLRIRREGSGGGQKGLANVLERLGTQAVPRLRIGVGSAYTEGKPAEEAVLSKFAPDEREVVERMLGRADEAIEAIVRDGIEKAMNEYNEGSAE